MAFSPVSYNSKAKIFEVRATKGNVATFFVFPAQLQEGDSLPSLYITSFKRNARFIFSGTYNKKTDNLEFFLEGPEGYRYKASLQVDVPNEPYSWKLKRHAHTCMGKNNDATMFFVPRSICLEPKALLRPEVDVVNRWSFFGESIPARFGRLRLKMKLAKAKCAQNPEAAGDRQSVGLRGYYELEEVADGEHKENNAKHYIQTNYQLAPTQLHVEKDAQECQPTKPKKKFKISNATQCDETESTDRFLKSNRRRQIPIQFGSPTIIPNQNSQVSTGVTLSDNATCLSFNSFTNWVPTSLQSVLLLPNMKLPSMKDLSPKLEAMWTNNDDSLTMSERLISTKDNTFETIDTTMVDKSQLDTTLSHMETTVNDKTKDYLNSSSTEKKLRWNLKPDFIVENAPEANSQSRPDAEKLSQDSERTLKERESGLGKEVVSPPPSASNKKAESGVKVKKNFNQQLLGFRNIQVSLGGRML